MRKRSRRRRPKRSGQQHDDQRGQKLSKQVQELYPSQGAARRSAGTHSDASVVVPADGREGAGEESDWANNLEEALLEPAPPRARGRRRLSSKTAPLEDQPSPLIGPELQGRVVAISSGACTVEGDDVGGDGDGGEGDRDVYDCVLPSDLARDQRATIAIGDRVTFGRHGPKAYRLSQVLPRRSTLSRPDPLNPHRERVIAANIDIAIHVASVVEPPLRPALIDRYLIAIERGGAAAAVCVNKVDLFENIDERRKGLDVVLAYRDLGVDVLPCSAQTGEGLAELRSLLTGRTAVLVGHSGVGKSSLLNALSPHLDAATGRVSEAHGRGQHTTTRSNLYHLDGGIEIIDTPGIREFGLWKLTTAQVRAYFADFEPFAEACRFANCGHTHEPSCAVRSAIGTGDISAARYQTYLRILDSLDPSPHA